MANVTPPPPVKTKPYKAIAGGVVTLLGLLWAGLAGHDTLANMGPMEWLSIVVPALLTTATVYGIPNPAVNRADRPRGQGGYTDIIHLLLVLLVVIVVIWVLFALF